MLALGGATFSFIVLHPLSQPSGQTGRSRLIKGRREMVALYEQPPKVGFALGANPSFQLCPKILAELFKRPGGLLDLRGRFASQSS
jgi:hypothetical protein